MNIYEDRIADFLDRCYKAGIKDPVRFMNDKMPRVYGWLRGAFPRNILPTDVDGEVEINGHFLRLEFKHEDALREGRIPKGQAKCFEQLLETGVFTVMLIGHDSKDRITCASIWLPGKPAFKKDPATNDWIFSQCKRWAEFAERPRTFTG